MRGMRCHMRGSVRHWLKYEATRDPGWVDKARVACGNAVVSDASVAGAYVCLGTVELGTGEYEKAIAAFERALRTEPTSDEAYLGLARAQDRLGLSEAAEQTYRQAVDLRPSYWASRLGLAASTADTRVTTRQLSSTSKPCSSAGQSPRLRLPRWGLRVGRSL